MASSRSNALAPLLQLLPDKTQLPLFLREGLNPLDQYSPLVIGASILHSKNRNSPTTTICNFRRRESGHRSGYSSPRNESAAQPDIPLCPRQHHSPLSASVSTLVRRTDFDFSPLFFVRDSGRTEGQSQLQHTRSGTLSAVRLSGACRLRSRERLFFVPFRRTDLRTSCSGIG